MVTVVAYFATLCCACGRCVDACPGKVLKLEEQHVIRGEGCSMCGRCVEVCPKAAREIVGKVMNTEDVFKEVRKDRLFYKHSGGGVTVSGGEPLSQPEFVSSLLKRCREEDIRTCIETCGFAARSALDRVMQFTDVVLYDIKHLNDERHKELTGVSNQIILDNLRYIALDLKKEIWLRMPLIQGVNDDLGLIRQTAELVLPFRQSITGVYLLPYHTLGISKLQALGRSADMCADYRPPEQAQLEHLAGIWTEYGFSAHINGQ